MAAAGLGVSLMHDMTIPQPRPPGLAVLAIVDAEGGSRWADLVTLASRRSPASDVFVAMLRDAAERRAGAGRAASPGRVPAASRSAR